MRDVTALVACARLCTAAVLAGAVGCGIVPSSPPSPAPPDVQAIVVVVEDAHAELGQVSGVFLAVDGAEDTTMARVRSALSNDLASTFWPSSARISGDPGASIALGRFNLEADGRLSVVASFVQENGLVRGCREYSLEREGEDWLIAEEADAWPNCPMSTQGEESYHAALARARSVECLGLWSTVGTCGDWLYFGEWSGFGGTRWLFDWRIGPPVATEWCTDVAEGGGLCHSVHGGAECEPE